MQKLLFGVQNYKEFSYLQSFCQKKVRNERKKVVTLQWRTLMAAFYHYDS